MASVTLDIRTLSAEERGGTIVSLQRRAFVTGLATQDFGVLMEALDDAGVPQAGDSLPGFDNLVLVKRAPRVFDQANPSKVEIDLEYRAKGGGAWRLLPRQDGSGNDLGFVWRGDTTLQQDRSRVNFFGEEIVVSHTYPSSDIELGGQTINQTGVINVQRPKTTLSNAGVIQASYPDNISRFWTGTVNAAFWAGNPPGTWLCTRVAFSALDLSLAIPTWNFEFSFEFDYLGQQPEAIFNDARPTQGGPPINLVDGVGFFSVFWYPELDFNIEFPI